MYDDSDLPEWHHLDQIIEGLFLGDDKAARDEYLLHENGITAIVNVAKDIDDPYKANQKQFKFGLVDGESWENHPEIYFLAALTCLRLLDRGERVLLHCIAGISRSPAVCCLVLVVKGVCEDLDAAESYIRGIRHAAWVHSGHVDHVRAALEMLKGFYNDKQS